MLYARKSTTDEMLKRRTVASSRDGAKPIELFKPLMESLLANWDYKTFDQNLLNITLLNQAQNRYNTRYEY